MLTTRLAIASSEGGFFACFPLEKPRWSTHQPNLTRPEGISIISLSPRSDGMLDLLGPGSRLCDHITRREMLRIGGLAPMGLGLASLLAGHDRAVGAEQSSIAGSFGRAKRCLLMFMWGGPSHIDLFDMKPNAPREVRGEFNPAATSVPGLQMCELLPRLGRHADKLSLIRSLTHTDNNHSTSAHWMLTGRKPPFSAENFSAKGDDFPHLGSVVTKLAPSNPTLPTFVALPETISTTIGAIVPGQNGGIIGKQYDPFRIEQHPDLPDFKVGNLALPGDLSAARMAGRKELLGAFDSKRRSLLADTEIAALDDYQRRALELITSPEAHRAFDLAAESDATRDRYGRETFGQSLLLGRRLLEAGVRLVTVYWHRERPGGTENSWDTHGANFTTLKNRLLPQVDGPLDALLSDLQERGMLDDTLVVWSSEFGRTPKVNGNNGGRDHWGPCNSIWMAGAGVPGGYVHGVTDKIASEPIADAVHPADITATIFWLLGLRPESLIYDPLNRPLPISEGQPIKPLV